VTAVTDAAAVSRDTSIVSMVRRAGKNRSPRARRHEAVVERGSRFRFVNTGITSSRVLPTSNVGYWSPYLPCDRMQAPPRRRVPSGAIFFRANLKQRAVIAEDTNFSHLSPTCPIFTLPAPSLRQALPNAALLESRVTLAR
jgi:hypothetical protein